MRPLIALLPLALLACGDKPTDDSGDSGDSTVTDDSATTDDSSSSDDTGTTGDDSGSADDSSSTDDSGGADDSGSTDDSGGDDTGQPEDVLISFDDPNVTYTLTGFGGAEDSAVEVDPTDSSNMVARVSKSTGNSELWAGCTMSTGEDFSIETLAITETDTTFTLRVWSPDANVPIRLKVEDASDPTKSVETEAMVTVAETWETLTFDFANEANGTAALNPSYTFNKVSVFPHFGTTGADGGGGTYYFDDFAEAF